MVLGIYGYSKIVHGDELAVLGATDDEAVPSQGRVVNNKAYALLDNGGGAADPRPLEDETSSRYAEA